MISRILVLASVLVLSQVVPVRAAPDLAELTQKADAVLAKDSPAARGEVNTVFAAGDALADAGQLDRAEFYYQRGLRIQSHDIAHHLKYAQVLDKDHKPDDARTQAKIVLEVGEDPAQIKVAQSLLGITPDAVEPFDVTKEPADVPLIILVPIGDADSLLIQQEKQKLHDELGIEVQVHSLPVQLRKPARNALQPQAEAVRKSISALRDRDAAGFAKMLEAAGMSEEDLKDDSKLIHFVAFSIRASGNADRAAQVERLLVNSGDQWSAEDMLADLQSAVPANTGPRLRFIGVTNEDIFGKGTNFLFGLAGQRCAVISYRRFTASFNQEDPSRIRLLRRFHFQSLTSAGRVFGIPACDDPTCPRCYPHSLAEQDAKTEKLCDSCHKAFEAAFKSN